MKILIFGNPLLKEDSLPIKILPKLQVLYPEIEFKEIDPTEDIEPFLNTETPNTKHQTPGDFIAIDICKGITEIKILDSIEQLHTNKIYSMHDFDLALNLKLLKKLNLIKKIKIIAIPMEMTEREALAGISKILK